MSIRGIVGVLAVLGGLEASLILPKVSAAQLAETMTTTRIQGDVHSMQKSNLLTPGRRAKSIAGIANQRRADERAALDEGPTQQNSAAQAGGPQATNAA